jgi:hypothetical protein
MMDENYVEIELSCYQSLGFIKVYYSPADAKVNYLENNIKIYLKQLRHFSVQSHHHQGAHYSFLLKLQLLK